MRSPFRLLGTVTLGRGVLNTFERDHLLLPGGGGVRRDRLTHPGAVVIVPVGSEGIWMLRQYRPAVREWVWELPAGLCEPGEEARDTAVRECMEETGQEPETVTDLGELVTSPGILDERVRVYLAEGLRPVGRRPDDHEELLAEVVEVPVTDLSRMIVDGDLCNAITIAALAMAGLAPGIVEPGQ